MDDALARAVEPPGRRLTSGRGLALLPLAVVVAPLWLRHGHRLGRLRHLLLELVVAGFALLVALAYALPLGWTGFPGNTLWDWLELLVLPLAVVLVPVWIDWLQLLVAPPLLPIVLVPFVAEWTTAAMEAEEDETHPEEEAVA